MILGLLGLFGTAVSTGFSIFAQNQAAEAQEQAAEYNNLLARREASNLEAETAESIKRRRIENRAGLADLRTRLASSGVLTTTGTPLLLQGEAAGRLELQIADAARSASMQAASLRAKGRMGLWEADQNTSAARMSMLGTALKGAASAFGQYSSGSYLGIYPRVSS